MQSEKRPTDKEVHAALQRRLPSLEGQKNREKLLSFLVDQWLEDNTHLFNVNDIRKRRSQIGYDHDPHDPETAEEKEISSISNHMSKIRIALDLYEQRTPEDPISIRLTRQNFRALIAYREILPPREVVASGGALENVVTVQLSRVGSYSWISRLGLPIGISALAVSGWLLWDAVRSHTLRDAVPEIIHGAILRQDPLSASDTDSTKLPDAELQFAKDHRFSQERVHNAVLKWADETDRNSTANPFQRGLAAYARGDFHKAEGLFAEAAEEENRLKETSGRGAIDSELVRATSLQKLHDFAGARSVLTKVFMKLDKVKQRALWIDVAQRVGNAKVLEGWFGGDAGNAQQNLDDAIHDFRVLLAELSGPGDRQQEGAVRNSLAVALMKKADGSPDPQPLYKQAMTESRMAAQIFSRVDEPDQWAKATYNLGLIFYSLGHFEEAADRLHEAIGVYNRVQQLQNWAITEIDLGMVLTAQAQSATSAWEPLAAQAEKAQRDAIGVLTKTGPDPESARAHLNLGAVLLLEVERGGGPAALDRIKQSIEETKTALQIFPKDSYAKTRAQAEDNLGEAYEQLAKHSGVQDSVAFLKLAVEAHETALPSYPKGSSDWVLTQTAIADDLVLMASHSESDADAVCNQAIARYQATIEMNRTAEARHAIESKIQGARTACMAPGSKVQTAAK